MRRLRSSLRLDGPRLLDYAERIVRLLRLLGRSVGPLAVADLLDDRMMFAAQS